MLEINYKNKNFLIIDNLKPSHDILKKFAITLTNKQVDSTLYAQDVIPMCLEKRYDIILLGYDLGDKQKNGQQLLEELRTSQIISRQCIVIIITAEVSQAMVLAALEHKPDSYLRKPYTLQELHKRLNKCMAKKDTMADIYQALDDNDKKLAINLVNEALANNTLYRMECLGIKSRQFFELEKYDLAQNIYNTYKDEPNCQWAAIGLGKIALHKNELSKAEEIFKEIIEQQPLYLPTYDWLASTYQKKSNNLDAEEALEKAISLSPRSIVRLKAYAGLCFENEHYEQAANAYHRVYNLASNSIHQVPENALMFAKSLAGYSATLPRLDAKKMNNRAFSMMSQMNKTFNQVGIKIQSYLLSACLLENIHDYMVAKNKLNLGLKLLDEERQNLDVDDLTEIANSLTKLNRNTKASQILVTANRLEANNKGSSSKIGELSDTQLNESVASKAQKALEEGKRLFEARKYSEAIESLNEALALYPNHIGIQLNLLQVLLEAYEEDKFRIKDFQQAKKLILEILNRNLDDEASLRFKKLRNKYQQIASI